MSDKRRIAIDLEKLAEALPPAYAPLAGKIRRCRDTHAVHSDLMHAAEMVDSVGPAFEAAQSGTAWAQKAVPALMHNAIILYARATHSGSDHRSRINLTKHFDADQMALHNRLIALRNDALAHYGPGEITGGFAWNEERLLIALGPPNHGSIMAASRRVGYAPYLPSQMATHIAQVLSLARREVERRDADLANALNGGILASGEVFDMAMQHTINIGQMFGSHPAAALLDEDRSGAPAEIIWGPMVQPAEGGRDRETEPSRSPCRLTSFTGHPSR